MPDFSHYRKVRPDSLNRHIAAHTVTDTMFHAVLVSFDRPFLAKRDWHLLLSELDEAKQRKRGRPKAGVSVRVKLADKVAALSDSVLAADFKHALVARLRSGKRFRQAELEERVHRLLVKRRRDMFLRCVADNALAPRDGDNPSPICGIWPVESFGPPRRARADQALRMASEIVRQLGFFVPAADRVRDIVYARRKLVSRKIEPKNTKENGLGLL